MGQAENSQLRQMKGKQEFEVGPVWNPQKHLRKKKKKLVKYLPGPDSMKQIYDSARQVRTFLTSRLIFLPPTPRFNPEGVRYQD